MTHNTSHTRIRQIKCSESSILLQFKFQIRLQSFKRKIEEKKHFAEAGTLDESGWHLALEMPTSRTAHTERERESTTVKQHQGKS
jgi:hypothetical protein